MKYIKTRTNVIIFSGGISHAEMAQKFGPALSAGFVDTELKAFGKSISLKISSDEKDTEHIRNRFNRELH